MLAKEGGFEASRILDWWWLSQPFGFGPFGGGPTGPPRWPGDGDVEKAPNKLVEAVKFLTSEYRHATARPEEKKRPEAPKLQRRAR